MKYWLSFVLFFLLCSLSWGQQCTQAQLNVEFTGDPTARAYSTCAGFPNGDDACVLTKFNAPCTDAACKVDQVVTREQVWEVIDPTEYTTLLRSTAANDVARLRELDHALSVVSFNLSLAKVRQKWSDIFPAPSSPITNAALQALQQKNVPRSQIVCGRPATLCDVSLGLRNQAC